MAKFVKIKYDGKSKRFQYPTGTTKDFLDVVRTELNIDASAVLTLLCEDEELSTSATLEGLGVPSGSKLELVSETKNQDFIIKLQTLSGETFEFRFNNQATLKDLYDEVRAKIDCTTTFPLLFNHRMHIFKSEKILAEPIINFLPLTIINDAIPHFYLFQCEHRFETSIYNHEKNLNQIFLDNDLWQPKSGVQSKLAMSIYLNTMFALVRVFLSQKDADFDSVHNVYMPQFLIVLRRYLFPPACLAFKHAIEGALFDFEKLLLSEAFFQFLRALLPKHIPDSELFSYAPHVMCWIFSNADHTSTESSCYESVELVRRLTTSNNTDTSEESTSYKYYTEPVRLLNNKINQSANERFILMEYQDARANLTLTENDYQRQTDLMGFLIALKHFKTKYHYRDSANDDDTCEVVSNDYTLWVPDTGINLLLIGNVSEQKRNLKCLSENDLEDIKEKLSTNDLFSIFTFADPSSLSKYNHAQFLLLESGSVVYITSNTKCKEDSFNCFDPCDEKDTVSKDDAASKEVLEQHPSIVIRENATDIRKIEQVTCILFDISGSMHTMVGNEDNKHTLLELSTMAFGAWRDRLLSYRLPHAIGLIYFGADDEPPSDRLNLRSFPNFIRFRMDDSDDRIIVQCKITRDFTYFDKALANQPNCGFDTPLYDAIDVAIQNILSFRENSKARLSPACKELILCLTDGADNCSRVSKSNILEKLLSNNIVFDAISFDSMPNNVLMEFCEKTKGYYYADIQHNHESMLNLFELEATISVQDRKEGFYGKIEQPQRRQPKLLDKPAIAAKQARISDGRASNIALRRVMFEINNLNKSILRNFDLFISSENIFFWKVIMHGETGTPYSGGRWLLFIEFPLIYPQQPPEIRFITKIYHCNINDDGKICHDILNTAWSEKTSMHSVFMEILRLLREPNADDALSSVKGAMYKESREDYDNTIIEWKNLYASKSVDELKAQYFLE